MQKLSVWCRSVSYCCGCRTSYGICNSEIYAHCSPGDRIDCIGILLGHKKIEERRDIYENCCGEGTEVSERNFEKSVQNENRDRLRIYIYEKRATSATHLWLICLKIKQLSELFLISDILSKHILFWEYHQQLL